MADFPNAQARGIVADYVTIISNPLFLQDQNISVRNHYQIWEVAAPKKQL